MTVINVMGWPKSCDSGVTHPVEEKVCTTRRRGNLADVIHRRFADSNLRCPDRIHAQNLRCDAA